MSRRQKTGIVEGLTEKLSELKEQKSKLETEAHEWAEKRDELNERTKNLRTEVLELRSQRDKLNNRVKELKQHRDGTTARIHEKLEEMSKLEEENRALAKKKPSKSHEVLQKEVESIDWTIQTTPLTLQEDKELVEKVRHLETQLAVHKKLEQLTQKIAELRIQVRAMKSESELLHKELTENAHKSQETHKKMLKKMEESKALKTEADNMHKQFLAAKEKVRPLLQEMKVALSHISQLKGEMRQEEQKRQKESQDALRETLEKQAKEKLKRHEKLSWEEFQLLAEKGMTEQDQSG